VNKAKRLKDIITVNTSQEAAELYRPIC